MLALQRAKLQHNEHLEKRKISQELVAHVQQPLIANPGMEVAKLTLALDPTKIVSELGQLAHQRVKQKNKEYLQKLKLNQGLGARVQRRMIANQE